MAAILSVVIAGCGASLNIPRPGALAPPLPPPIPLSTVTIPIRVNLAPMAAEVERAVPTEQRASNWTVVANNVVGDVGVKYELRRDPIRLVMAGNVLRATSRVRYWFEFAQRVPRPIVGGAFWQELGSCGVGEAQRIAELGLETQLIWRDDWSMMPKTRVVPIVFPNKCEITFLKFDITGRVESAFAEGLKKGAALADEKIRSVAQFKSAAERAWKALQEPIRLDSGVWLTIDPRATWVGPMRGVGQTVEGSVGFSAMPRVTFGPRPAVGTVPLPKIETNQKPGLGAAVIVEGEIAYAEAARLLSEALAAERFSYAGHDIRVTNAQIYGAGEKLVVGLRLSGDVAGEIFLIGTPAYDATKNVVFVKDLDYSLETSNALATVADWLLHGTFRASIAEGARWPLAEAVAETRARIQKTLSKPIAPNVRVVHDVGVIEPAGVFVTPRGITARLAIKGTIHVDL